MQLSAGRHRAEPAVESVLSALMSIGRLMRQRIHTDDVDPGTFWLLKTLDSSGPVRVTDLAATAKLDVSTISRHITQLHRAGLIERGPDPLDRRAQRVGLSLLGKQRLANALGRRHAILAKSLEGWDAHDIDQFGAYLSRFATDLETRSSDLESA
jgi:DNA-binding MarR family transcriptional regulator